MFSNLLFLVLVLLVTTLGEGAASTMFASPWQGLLFGGATYALVMSLLKLQNHFLLKRNYASHTLVFLSNIELVTVISLFFLTFGGQRVFDGMPLGFEGTLNACMALSMYFGGLALVHWTTYDPFAHIGDQVSRREHVALQLRFMAPFTVPFMVFTFLGDFAALLPLQLLSQALGEGGQTLIEWAGAVGSTFLFVAVMMVFLPFVITKAWQCEPLKEGPVLDRLENLCQRARFRHAGMQTWMVMRQSMTAAIIGVVPRFRYVMFTPALLEQLSLDSVEAVLAHEIGHSQRKHLLIYPLVIFGAMVLLAYYALFFAVPLDTYVALQSRLHPSTLWSFVQPMMNFVPYVVVLVLYARIVFGFFSRQFERQADLHVYEVGLPARAMIDALDQVAVLSGNIHAQPNWHHYSIQQRIDFLQLAEAQPAVIKKHHRRVRSVIAFYFTVLTVAVALLLDMSSEGTPYWTGPSQWAYDMSEKIDRGLNKKMREDLALQHAETYRLGNSRRSIKALERAFRKPGAIHYPGIAEYYAAQMLLDAGDLSSSAVMMTGAWKAFDFHQARVEAVQEFSQLTQRILWAIQVEKLPVDEETHALRAAAEKIDSL